MGDKDESETRERTSENDRGLMADEYALLIDSLHEYAIFSLDVNGLIMTWNTGAHRVFGYDAEEAVGLSGNLIFSPEDRAEDLARQEMSDALVHGRGEDDRWHQRKDGTSFWANGVMMPLCDDDGTHRGFVKIIRDRTQEKQAQDALKASESRFRAVTENILDIIIIANPQTIVQYASPSIESILGYGPAELIGRSLLEFIHTEDRHQVRNALTRQLLETNFIVSHQVRIANKAGELCHLEFKAKNLLDDPGIEGLLITMQDITELKRTEANLKLALKEAEDLSHIKTRLLTNMSHEIRTPLTSMVGLAHLLAQRIPRPYKADVLRIEASGLRLAETLNSVLTLAQLESNAVEVHAEPIDIRSEIEESILALKPLATKNNLKLDTHLPREPVIIRTDRALLSRIVTNLVGNAIKFTRQGRVDVTLTCTDDEALLLVKDTGIGIDPAFLPQLFAEFSQESSGLSRAHEGTGLGLAITRGLVELLAGSIEVESEKGKGTTFKVRLPRLKELAFPRENSAPEDSASEDSAPQKSGEPPMQTRLPPPLRTDRQGSPTILIVEDNAIIRELLVSLLEERFQVVAVKGAEPALEIAAEVVFDMIFLDISLPEMDGVEGATRLRQLPGYETRPIVAITGHVMPGDKRTFYKAGFDAVIEKPFTSRDLFEALDRFLPQIDLKQH